MPGVVGAHGADLHADATDGQFGREGEGSDPVTLGLACVITGPAPVITGLAPAAAGLASVAAGPAPVAAAADSAVVTLVSYGRHVLFVPSLSRDHCPRFTTG